MIYLINQTILSLDEKTQSRKTTDRIDVHLNYLYSLAARPVRTGVAAGELFPASMNCSGVGVSALDDNADEDDAASSVKQLGANSKELLLLVEQPMSCD